jgi:hypothetical protein
MTAGSQAVSHPIPRNTGAVLGDPRLGMWKVFEN